MFALTVLDDILMLIFEYVNISHFSFVHIGFLKYFSFSLKRVEHPKHGTLANVSTTCPVGVNSATVLSCSNLFILFCQ